MKLKNIKTIRIYCKANVKNWGRKETGDIEKDRVYKISKKMIPICDSKTYDEYIDIIIKILNR